jgi:hypothetical protein
VKAKLLGDGFVGLPVYEVRGSVLRPFLEKRMSLGVNFLVGNRYVGQRRKRSMDGREALQWSATEVLDKSELGVLV